MAVEGTSYTEIDPAGEYGKWAEFGNRAIAKPSTETTVTPLPKQPNEASRDFLADMETSERLQALSYNQLVMTDMMRQYTHEVSANQAYMNAMIRQIRKGQQKRTLKPRRIHVIVL